MSGNKQESILEPKSKFESDKFANDFMDSIKRLFPSISRLGKVMVELIEEVYPKIKEDLNIGKDGENPRISLAEICDNGFLDKAKFDVLVLEYIPEFNKKRKYEYLEIYQKRLQGLTLIPLITQIVPIQKPLDLIPNLENPDIFPVAKIKDHLQKNLENDLENEAKNTAKMLKELKERNFGNFDKTEILAFLDFLESIDNFEIKFANNRIIINPLPIDISLDDKALQGYNQKEQDFYRLMANFIEAKELEKETVTKINELKENPNFSLATRYAHEVESSSLQILAAKINGIIKDQKLQNIFIGIINKIREGNNASEFDINLFGTSSYRLTTYLFNIKNTGLDTFHESNLTLENIAINQSNFDTFIQALGEFVKRIKEKRSSFLGGHLGKENWSEVGGINLKNLEELRSHLLSIYYLVEEIEKIKIGKDFDETAECGNLEMDRFLTVIKGLKTIESRLFESGKFKKVVFEVLHPVKTTQIMNEKKENQRILENTKEITINSTTLTEILYSFFCKSR